MMISRRFMKVVLGGSVFSFSLAAAFGLLLGGAAVGLAILVGGAVVALDGALLVYLVGRISAEDRSSVKQAALVGLLFFKLIAAGAVLWVALSVFQVHGLGLVLGMGAGLLGLFWALAQWGSSTVAPG